MHINVMTIRRRIVGRVPSTRLGAFFLLPSICSHKIEKRVDNFFIDMCNSLGKPAFSFSLCRIITHYELRITN